MNAPSITVDAPAKINLFLHLTGRRPDGYHLIDSVFVFTDLCDRLAVTPSDRLVLSAGGPWASALEAAGGENIVLRAAHLLAREAGIKPTAQITLDKHIPVAAGLGGGSADAAAALIALDRLWRLDSSSACLSALALELGADVPACLVGQPQHVRGIGDLLAPLEGSCDYGLLLANPRRAVPTPRVFAAFREGGHAFRTPSGDLPEWRDIDWLAGSTGNDLEAPARSLEPTIGELLDTLAGLPGCRLARMSGSGASCFALFDDRAAARRARQILVRMRPAWWSCATGLRTVPAEISNQPCAGVEVERKLS